MNSSSIKPSFYLLLAATGLLGVVVGARFFRQPALVDSVQQGDVYRNQVRQFLAIKDPQARLQKADALLKEIFPDLSQEIAGSDLTSKNRVGENPLGPKDFAAPTSSGTFSRSTEVITSSTPIAFDKIDTLANMNSDPLKGWIFVGDGKDDYASGINPHDGPNRQSSMYISGKVENPKPWAQLVKGVEIDGLLGRTVRLTAYVRYQGVERAKFFAIAHTTDRVFEFREFKGSSDWTKLNVYIDVPIDAKSVQFGISLTGKGSIAFSELSYEVL